MSSQWNDKIFTVTEAGFDSLALEIFHFQYQHNAVYREYVDALGVEPQQVQQVREIPFLPIRFFKSHAVTTHSFDPQLVFESSGTTGSVNSKHLVREAAIYEESFTKAFRQFYGAVEDWCVIGLLPAYLERQGSSLVYMVDKLVQSSKHPASGFYLYDFEKLQQVLQQLEQDKQPVLLIGVTFALLDFAQQYPVPLQYTVMMETGGMKGRREELIRPQVHEILQQAFGLPAIHAEYGMTELLSQAYSKGNGLFTCPPWMKIMIREEEDPLTVRSADQAGEKPLSGAINIIDLANIYSCSFIATDDAGQLLSDGSFRVMGRLDNSDIRGCSLMVL
jgi:phenylacetate-coenzyme A ligase PaaK-like adenylate-forming protein